MLVLRSHSDRCTRKVKVFFIAFPLGQPISEKPCGNGKRYRGYHQHRDKIHSYVLPTSTLQIDPANQVDGESQRVGVSQNL